jgi:hypothetical protein
MKSNKEQIISFALLLIRLCGPGTVFIGLCTFMIFAFDPVLLLLDQIAPWFIGGAWLSLLIIYILLGIAFIFFEARFLRKHFGHKKLPIQRFIVFLSGIPFYTVEILFILTFVYSNNPNISTAALFISAVGSLGFFIISCVYFFLTWFLLKRSTTLPLPQ